MGSLRLVAKKSERQVRGIYLMHSISSSHLMRSSKKKFSFQKSLKNPLGLIEKETLVHWLVLGGGEYAWYTIRIDIWHFSFSVVFLFNIHKDESQEVRTSGTKVAKMAAKIPSIHRWAISGTPIKNAFSDIKVLPPSPFWLLVECLLNICDRELWYFSSVSQCGNKTQRRFLSF